MSEDPNAFRCEMEASITDPLRRVELSGNGQDHFSTNDPPLNPPKELIDSGLSGSRREYGFPVIVANVQQEIFRQG